MKTREITPKTLLTPSPKKNMPHFKHLVLFSVAAVTSVTSAGAATLTKADNGLTLKTAGTYTDALVAAPTNADTVVFDSTFATTTSTISAGGANMRSLQILDPGHDVKININSAACAIGVNNGASGSINLSSATKDLTISATGGAYLRMYGSAPTITVALGRTLTISAQLQSYNNTLNIGGAGEVMLSGVVKDATASAPTSIAYNGTGNLTLSAVNTYTGTTSVNAGTVQVNGSIAGTVSVGAAGKLNGSGQIAGAVTTSGSLAGTLDFGSNVVLQDGGSLTGSSHTIAGSLTAASGATVAPGEAAGDIGTLTVGTFTLSSEAHLAMDINGAVNADQIITTGNDALSLDGDLTLSIGAGFSPADMDSLTLILNDGSGNVLNTFSKVTVTFGGNSIDYSGAEGTILTIGNRDYALSYTSGAGFNDVALIAVPEPSTWAMLMGGLGALVALQRRGRQQNG